MLNAPHDIHFLLVDLIEQPILRQVCSQFDHSHICKATIKDILPSENVRKRLTDITIISDRYNKINVSEMFEKDFSNFV